jgi:hypothetical protein
VSVSGQRDSERAALVLERRELAESPQAEVAELARIAVTIIAVLAALVATGAASAALGRAPRRPAVVRNVIGGAITMGVTYGIGTLIASRGHLTRDLSLIRPAEPTCRVRGVHSPLAENACSPLASASPAHVQPMARMTRQGPSASSASPYDPGQGRDRDRGSGERAGHEGAPWIRADPRRRGRRHRRQGPARLARRAGVRHRFPGR